MSLKIKIWTLALLWISIVCTAVLATDSLIIRIILAAVLLGVTIHIVLIKTLRDTDALTLNKTTKNKN